jgi:hypothetical protein
VDKQDRGTLAGRGLLGEAEPGGIRVWAIAPSMTVSIRRRNNRHWYSR